MTEEEAQGHTHDGLVLLANLSSIVAVLPLEIWIEAFERAEAMQPLDLKAQIVKGLIKAAIPLKEFVLSNQDEIARMKD